MHLNQRSYDAAINSLTLAVALNPSDADRRELDMAYHRKKKALAGTGGRIVTEDLRLERMFVAHKQYATEPLGRIRLRNDSAEDYQGLAVVLHQGIHGLPVTRVHGAQGQDLRRDPLNATFNRKVLDIDEDTRVLVITTLAMADVRDGSQEVTQAMTLYGRNALVWANSDMIGSYYPARRYAAQLRARGGEPLRHAAQAVLIARSARPRRSSTPSARRAALPARPEPSLLAPQGDQVDYVQFPARPCG